jgi:hypothetical protein
VEVLLTDYKEERRGFIRKEMDPSLRAYGEYKGRDGVTRCDTSRDEVEGRKRCSRELIDFALSRQLVRAFLPRRMGQ